MISAYKDKSKKLLAGKWGTVVLVVLVGLLVSMVTSNSNADSSGFNFPLNLGNIVSIALLPLAIGKIRIYADISKGKNPNFEDIIIGFKEGRYLLNLAALLVRGLYIFFWSLLLVVPGIIKAHAYAMTAYIIQDTDFPENDLTAIERSQELMRGKKAKLFMLNLSFIGWYILSMFTFGLLLLYVLPYHMTTVVLFFNDIKKEANVKTVIVDNVDEEIDPFERYE